MAGRKRAVLVALRDDHQRAIDRHHLVEKHRDVHRPRLRHAVIARPGAVVLVPLPYLALERRFGVDLELVDVDPFAEQLLQRIDQPRMMGEQPKYLAEGVRGERGARRARFLPPYFLALGLEDGLGLGAEQGDLLLGEAIGEKQVTLRVEIRELLGRELHGSLLQEPVWPAGARSVYRSSLVF